MKSIFVFMIILFIILVVAAAIIFWPRTASSTKEITILDRQLTVLLADSTGERIRGLSGMEQENMGAEGMLFVFSDSSVRQFWMKDMKFNLDVVWIDGDKVVKVDSDVPAPASGETPARMSSDPFSVNYVLELPAGRAAELDLFPGQTINIR